MVRRILRMLKLEIYNLSILNMLIFVVGSLVFKRSNYKLPWFRKSLLSLRIEERAADGHRYAGAPLILHETFTAQTPVLVGACAGDVLLFSQVSFCDESGVSPFFLATLHKNPTWSNG